MPHNTTAPQIAGVAVAIAREYWRRVLNWGGLTRLDTGIATARVDLRR